MPSPFAHTVGRSSYRALCVLNMCAMALTATMASDAVEMVLWPLKQQSHNARRIHRKRFRALRTVSAAPHGFFYPQPTGQRTS